MAIKNRLRYTETILLVVVWVVLIASPVFFKSDGSFDWQDLIQPLKTVAPLFIIFIFNRFLLVPGLLLKKKPIAYLAAVVGLIAVFTLGSYFFTSRPMPTRLTHEQQIQQRKPSPPYLGPPDGKMPPPNNRRQQGPVPPFANLLIFSILLVGFDTGLMTSFRLAKAERERAKLEKENAETQLAFLRNQVSPHFFMNTLNNIHSLIDIDSEEAKESIIRLSKLMRHLLYDSEVAQIPIQKEVDFIQNYVDLMKLRFSDKVMIKLSLPDQLPDKSIPPLLFTSYLENAFKHGISYQRASKIDIVFTSNSDKLTFEIQNSITDPKAKEEASGIGIENARKRLDLLYGNNYSLDIGDRDGEFYVLLNIPI